VGTHGGRGGSRGNPPQEHDNHPTAAGGEVGIAREYQDEAAIVCIHGGAASLPSPSAIKRFSREILGNGAWHGSEATPLVVACADHL
jgi:hypothetical protein